MFKSSKKIVALILSVCLCLAVAAPCAFAAENDYATREYIVSEFVQSVGRSSMKSSDAVLEMFADADEISDEYREDIGRAVVGGILKGYDDRTIRPGAAVSRVEAMVMLARCVPELEAVEEEIEFTDVPEWAEEEIAYLSRAGLVKGYGDGRLGSDDYITVEQVGFLVERSDDCLRTVLPGDSFYGYVNEKTFRNAKLDNAAVIDPIHGAVVPQQAYWSHFGDVETDIFNKEKEILDRLVAGELPREKGTVEQRIYDMLECIDSSIAVSDDDKENIDAMRDAILEAESVDELLEIVADIYELAGINVLFDINVALDKETGLSYPSFSIAATGDGALLAFRKSTNTAEHKALYAQLILDYFDALGLEYTEDEILQAIELQAKTGMDLPHAQNILLNSTLAMIFGLIDQEGYDAIVEDMKEEHPDLYDAATDSFINPTDTFVTTDSKVADTSFVGFTVCEELSEYGFTNLEKVILPSGEIAAAEKDVISEENLEALKINALLNLSMALGVSMDETEDLKLNTLKTFPLFVCLAQSIEDLNGFYAPAEDSSDEEAADEEAADEEAADEEAADEETAEEEEPNVGIELEDEGLLGAANLQQLATLLPNDMGLLYCKYYYDDEITDVVCQMFDDIWDAYEARFGANEWMAEETKANAIKKLDNMLAVIAYPDNYTFPEIIPISEGGSLFSNTLSVKRNLKADLIRCNEDKEFIRTQMLMPPDMVNACYIPMLNTINVPAGILKYPFYDSEASYAQNLGSIGMIIAHEIGHAFDKTGSQFDENGCLKNWWTEEDSKVFAEIQDEFVDYYAQFEVTDGVYQNSEISIGENMADFAAMQIIMDIIGDDEEAQKECFEAYATMWAKLGTEVHLKGMVDQDVHAANSVRVNAVVASFDQFYEIYDVQEGDAMYVAPEDRLRLW